MPERAGFTPMTGNCENHTYLDFYKDEACIELVPVRTLFAPQQVRLWLKEMLRRHPDLCTQIRNRTLPAEAGSPLAAFRDGLAWIKELRQGVRDGIRSPNGDLIHPMC